MEKPELIVDGKRLDGRGPEDLRPLKITAGVLNDADGSALVEWGKNKVLCGIHGPRECIPRHEASPYRALIKCRYMMSPFASKDEHGRSGPNRRSTEISKVIREVFENVVLAEKFPKTQIDIYVEVLQAEGGTRVASITAAAVALADAGIPMKDTVSSVAVGKAGGQLITDLGKEEDNLGESDVPIAFSRRKKDILLLQMDGLLTKDELLKSVEMAERASEKIDNIETEALQKNYEGSKERKVHL